jgi:putative FmdB family regulatory protein
MPIFEYQCQGCGYTFEKIQLSRNSAPGPACPKCHADQMYQLVSRFNSPSSETGDFACAPSALS